MNGKKYLLLCLPALFFFNSPLFAQDKLGIKFGKVNLTDFDVKSPLLDSNTNAIVIANLGKSEFIANTTDFTFSTMFKEKKRIKLINKNGFDAATIIIPLYIGDNGKAERLEDLDAYTYNIENGKVVSTKVEKSSVFTEKHSKHIVYKKFTFPAVKEGSIIEYSYEVKSDFLFNLPPWTFQGEYPVLWSQYEADIPEFFQYVVLSQGYQNYVVNKTDQRQVQFTFTDHVEREGGNLRSGVISSGIESVRVPGNSDYHTWIMKNVPALKEEAYTTTLNNSISKIEFQLKRIVYPNSIPKDYMNNWEKVSSDLMEDEDFGLRISRPNNWLDNDVATIVKNAHSQAEQATMLYEYVRDNFTANSKGVYTTASLKDIFKNKSGSVADINMLLIAMLRTKKIEADPVILSTRNHGFTNEYYPIMDKFNYVIARVMLDNNAVFLDASAPRLAFGKLPSEVYNGHARVINKEAPAVFFVADSVKESSLTTVFINSSNTGGVEGSFNSRLGFYESLRLRNKLAKSLMADYKKSVKESYPEEVGVENIEVDSLKLLDQPVGIRYDFKLKSFGDADIVYFSPMLEEGIKKNPFNAAERLYPVEMPYSTENTYTLNMEIPKGYKVDELPKSVRFNLNEDEGMFEYLVSNDGETVQMRCRLIIRKAKYLNEDYQSLREFYSFVVKKEAEQIVFKKIK